jgi:hypothetical protein
MKKLIASILVISVITCIVSGCSAPAEETPVTTAGETTAATTTEPVPTPGPSHDFTDVDDSMTFDDVYIEYDGTPWAEQHDLTFVFDDIETDFVRYMLDRDGNEYDNSPVHGVETVTRPIVKTYPSERDGYVVFEIDYTVLLPIDVSVNGDYLHSLDIYNSVRLVDYYTGYCYPEIRMTTDVKSFYVSGNVIYNGETYFVEYYQFNDTTYPQDVASISDSYSEWHQTTQMDITAYLIVPEGYDGMTMYVNISEYDCTYEEVLALEPYFPSTIMGEGEDEDYFDDYEFIALAQLL